MMTKQSEIEEECVAAINPNKPNIVDSLTRSVGFATNGYKCIHDNAKCVAKVIINQIGLEPKYFIKTNSFGKFFDPATVLDVMLTTKEKFSQNTTYSFKEVKKDAFVLYINYLESKSNNTAMLLQAERS